MTTSLGGGNTAGSPGPPHPATLPEPILLRSCEVRRERRSGPGGQHRNKVETAVVLTHLPTGVRGEASERRQQEQNRRKALFRLRVNLALKVRSSAVAPVVPSPLWTSRCRGGKIAVHPTHADFPALLAEALDAMEAAHMEARTASEWLSCTPTQLIRFLKIEPRGLEQVNRQRDSLGKSGYR